MMSGSLVDVGRDRRNFACAPARRGPGEFPTNAEEWKRSLDEAARGLCL